MFICLKPTKKATLIGGFKWRRRWDSNPRYAWTYDSFQDCSNQPLWHSSIRLFGCISILFAEKFLSTSSFSNLLADSRTWTDDLLITNELLYQLSYIGLLYTDFIFKHLATILCRADCELMAKADVGLFHKTSRAANPLIMNNPVAKTIRWIVFVRGRTPLGFNSKLSKCLFPLYGGGKDSAEQNNSVNCFVRGRTPLGSIPSCQSAYFHYMAAVRGIEPLFREWESLVLTTRRYRFM